MAKLVRGPKSGGFPGIDFRSQINATAAEDAWTDRLDWRRGLEAKLPTNNVFVKIETRMLSEHDFPKLAVTQQLRARGGTASDLAISLLLRRTRTACVAARRSAHLIILNPRDYRNERL